MTPTSVGMRCPECANQRTQVRSMPRRSPAQMGSRPLAWNDPKSWSATHVLIAINVLAFLWEVAQGGITFAGSNLLVSNYPIDHGVLFGHALSDGNHEYWRLVTSGFLHESIVHIGLNMWSLWFVGRSLEPAIGRWNFAGIYMASLLAGSFGTLVFEPGVPTLGASGAIFGVFGALIAIAHARHIPLWSSGLLPVLLFNLIYTITIPGVALGGHVGGVVAGLIAGRLYVELSEKRSRPQLFWAALTVIAVISVVGSLLVAGDVGIAPNGWTL
jgi:membrane associated rhomboid family serine protease